jgi:hypothetical protein
MITVASLYTSRPDHLLFADGSQHDGVASSDRSQRIGNSSRTARSDELVEGASAAALAEVLGVGSGDIRVRNYGQ